MKPRDLKDSPHINRHILVTELSIQSQKSWLDNELVFTIYIYQYYGYVHEFLMEND